MDKQTKQLILLGALVVVAGIVAFFMLTGDEPDTPPAKNNADATPQANASTPPGPANTGGTSKTGPQAGGTAAKTVDPEVYAELPPDATAPDPKWDWGWEAAASDEPFDPLRVKNLDVVDPMRQLHIQKLKEDWRLAGITVTLQYAPVLDDDGNQKMEPDPDNPGEERPMTKRQYVAEAWFKDKRRPYKERDRLTNTRFQIEKIYITKDGSGVRLKGDTGAEVDMPLAPPTRFDESFGK